MTSKRIRILLGLGLVLVVVALVVVVRLLNSGPGLVPVPPNPNGHYDFVHAGKALVGKAPDVTASLEELRSFVTQNSNALSLVRLGLSRKSRVPVEFTMNYASQRLPQLTAVKQLALALAAEGRLAELEQRTNDALTACIDTLRLGHEAVRGGLMIDKLVGLACEQIGLSRLEPLTGDLAAQECRRVARALEQVDQQGESPDEVLRTERTWARRSFGLAGRIGALVQFRSVRAGEQKFSQRCQERQLQRRRLMLALAVDAHEIEHGKKPDNYSALVPQYLSSIPIDPLTGTNLSLIP